MPPNKQTHLSQFIKIVISLFIFCQNTSLSYRLLIRSTDQMKREMPSTSKDSLKEPQPSKKQSTLDFFIKVQKPLKQQPTSANLSVKLQPNLSQLPSDKSNSHGNKNSYQSFDFSDPTPYALRPLAPKEQEQLATTYLNVHLTYVCQQCLNDITNYTKIKMNGKIYCVQCAGDIVDKPYTVMKALYDESLVQFPEQKKDYDEPIWSFKDQLKLIEALQLYGIDSYELIHDYMKTQHTLEDIEAHLQYFVNKFGPQMADKSVAARSLITVSADIIQTPNGADKKESYNFKTVEKKGKSPSKIQIYQKFSQRVENLLKIYNWKPQTNQLQYQSEPSLFSLLTSQITQQDIRQNHELIQIINQRRKYEIIEKQIVQKALKAIIFSQDEQQPFEDQGVYDIQLESLTDSQYHDNRKTIKNPFLSEDEEWTLFKCHVIKIYNILRPDQSKTLQTYLKRARLVHKLDKIEKSGDYELLKMRNKYCKENEIQKMSVEEFAQQLSEGTLAKVFNLEQTQKIHKELVLLNQISQKETQAK